MRLDQITFTRFLAAIAIVVFHFGEGIAPFSYKPIDFLFREGNVGVSYFFILSGFIMMISYNGKGTIKAGDYYRKRIARIYPLYLLAIMINAAWFLFSGFRMDYTGMILNIFLIQSWLPGYAISFNGPGWSLAVEALFYLLFPLLFNTVYRKVSLRKLWPPIILVWLITQLILLSGLHGRVFSEANEKMHQLLVYFPLMHLNQFLIGNLAGLFFLSIKDKLNRNLDLIILFVLCIFAFLLKHPIDHVSPGSTYHDGLMAVIFVPLIVLMAGNNGLITRVFNTRPLILLGEISYGIYILQRPVFFWSRQLVFYWGINSAAGKFYLFLGMLLVASFVSYFLVEVPLRRIISRSGARGNKLKEA